MYGTDIITPNMHMHCHLRASVEDYGPVHGFWRFAFEHYNCILGKIPCNNLSIETQLMQHFLGDNEILSTHLPEEFSSELKPLFPKQVQASGSLYETILPVPDHDLFLPVTSIGAGQLIHQILGLKSLHTIFAKFYFQVRLSH